MATGSLTYEGQIEAVGLFASGLRTNRRGRRRAGLLLAGLLGVLVVVAAVAWLVAG